MEKQLKVCLMHARCLMWTVILKNTVGKCKKKLNYKMIKGFFLKIKCQMIKVFLKKSI